MRLRGASVFVALFVLTSAATAHAECAWVLWRSDEGSEEVVPGGATRWAGPTWTIGDVYRQKAECDAVVAARLKGVPDHHPAVGPGYARMGDGSIGYFRDGVYLSNTKYTCYPDTVDPRGPKGK